uniref:Interleukin-7 receptor subunit alpha-like n=1 Tax=Sinocyclocheilus rhinocerous TaxID=307959 RepID=A0A673FM11_9TELE
VLLTNKKHLCFLSPQPIRPIIKYRNYSISRDRLVGDGVYYTRVRAKPWDFFAGDWSEWSSNATFTITSSTVPTTEKNFPKVGFIITFFVILVLIIGLGTLRWRAHIKDYITPNIPHPKATLAQMQRVIQFLMRLVASLTFCEIKPETQRLHTDCFYVFRAFLSLSVLRYSVTSSYTVWITLMKSHLLLSFRTAWMSAATVKPVPQEHQ